MKKLCAIMEIPSWTKPVNVTSTALSWPWARPRSTVLVALMHDDFVQDGFSIIAHSPFKKIHPGQSHYTLVQAQHCHGCGRIPEALCW
jgi:hypothetical protein